MTAAAGGARGFYVGDYNTGDASEPMYATLTAPNGTNQSLTRSIPSDSLTTNWDGSSKAHTCQPQELGHRAANTATITR